MKPITESRLTPEQYNICFLKGTEPPGSGKYLHTTSRGTYQCVNCQATLFSSATKYSSGTGWPSFWDTVNPKAIVLQDDRSLGIARTEVQCARCSAHLGHVFDDGPRDKTGKRYCINSLALEFQPVSER